MSAFSFAVCCEYMTDEWDLQHFLSLCDIVNSGDEAMKFELIIDKTKEEEIVATVHGPTALTEAIEKLVLEYAGADRITAYTEDDIKILKWNEIVCITVEDGKTYAVDIRGKRYRLKQRLYELEEILPASFLRINKSAIANERQIERFAANFSGAVDVVFKGGYREYVSRRCFVKIKRRYGL